MILILTCLILILVLISLASLVVVIFTFKFSNDHNITEETLILLTISTYVTLILSVAMLNIIH